MTISTVRCRLALASAITTSLAITSLHAQEASDETPGEMIDPTIVFGEVSNYQSWPLSASAVSGESLAEANRQNARDLSATIPNMAMTDTGLRAFGDVTSMRGLTNTPFFGGTSVVQYVDDVPQGNAFSHAHQLHAVDRVEVFRGPQGWLFGQNPYGGAVNIVSKVPGDFWEGDLFTQYGSYESFLGDAHVMGPLQENLFLKLGGSYTKRNGYLYNTTLRTHPDDQRHTSGSGTLYWRPGPDWDIRLSVSADRFEDGAVRLSPLAGDPYTVTSNLHGKTHQRSNNQALRIAYEGDDIRFLAVTSRREWEIDPYLFDLDLGPFPGNRSLIIQDQDLLSQEFRLSSVEGGDWEWSLGAYLASTEIDGRTQRDFFVPVPPNGDLFPLTTTTNYTLDEENYALFGQVSYHGIDRWGWHLGLRADYVKKSIERDAVGLVGPVPTVDESENYFYVSPRFGIDYELSDTSLAYLSTGLSHKPGGYSAFMDDPDQAEYDEERSWTTELGWKKTWLDDRLRTNVALFYNKIRDYQVERSLVATDYAVLNAERAESYGAEFEFHARLFDGFTVEGSLGVIETEFDRFTDPLTGADLSGNEAPFVPDLDASLAAVYRHESGFFGRVEVIYQGQTYFDDFNTETFEEPGYTLLNASLGYAKDGFELSVFGQNLTEEVYHTNISPDLSAGTVGAPMVVGLRCSYSF